MWKSCCKRSEDGRWNWQDYAFHPISDNPLIPPSVILENVRAQIQLEHGAGIPPASLIVTSPLFQAVPKSAEAYDFSGSLALPGAGNLALNGTCNLTTREWNLRGQLAESTADQSLMESGKIDGTAACRATSATRRKNCQRVAFTG